VDPSEKYNIANEHPEVIFEIRKILEDHQNTVIQVENQLEKY
jgi:arylsulfatase A